MRKSMHSLSPMNTVLSSTELPKFCPLIVILVPPTRGPIDGVTSVMITGACGITKESTASQPNEPER